MKKLLIALLAMALISVSGLSARATVAEASDTGVMVLAQADDTAVEEPAADEADDTAVEADTADIETEPAVDTEDLTDIEEIDDYDMDFEDYDIDLDDLDFIDDIADFVDDIEVVDDYSEMIDEFTSDSDGDGISDLDEFYLDSDGDGYSDFDEAAMDMDGDGVYDDVDEDVADTIDDAEETIQRASDN